MLLKIALWCSMLIQLITAIVAVSMVHKTNFKISWILISLGFILIAVERLFEFSSLFWVTQIFPKEEVRSWLGVAVSVMMFTSLYYIRQIFNLQDEVDRMRKENEKQLLTGIIQGEERARQAIASDLHDGIGPLLSSIKMIISSIDMEKMDPDNKKVIEKSCFVIDETIVTLKEISNDLSPHLLKNYGLIKALETFAKQLFENTPVQFRLTSDIGDDRLFYELEINMYRVITELLTNSMKHGNPGVISLNITRDTNACCFEYSDDGKGFDPGQYHNTPGIKGMGLKNISSRVKSLDGHFHMESAPGNGVRILINIPLK